MLYKLSAYNILQCKGCGTIFFGLERHRFSEGDDVLFQYFPATSIVPVDTRVVFSLYGNDLIHISSLYSEIVSAINGELPQLAAAGIRTIIDRICLHLGETKSYENTFAKNLEILFANKHVSEPQYAQLKVLTKLGGRVVHREHIPNIQDVALCFEVLNSLLTTLFIHSKIAKGIEERIK